MDCVLKIHFEYIFPARQNDMKNDDLIKSHFIDIMMKNTNNVHTLIRVMCSQVRTTRRETHTMVHFVRALIDGHSCRTETSLSTSQVRN